MNRRSFLVGLFGAAAVAAAGPIPKALAKLPEKDFTKLAKDFLPKASEVYGNGKDYAFAVIEWVDGPPYFKTKIPEGYRPLRDESDRIGAEAIAKMKRNA